MRPGYVSVLFLIIALILFAYSMRRGETGPSPIAQRSRRRTASIFVLVSVGLLVLDLLTH